jgi:hypothetical protein
MTFLENLEIPQLYRKRDFDCDCHIVGRREGSLEFANAIYRLLPSRCDNILELELIHRADGRIHSLVQYTIDNGLLRLRLRSMYPIPSLIRDDPLRYLTFDYRRGEVIDHWNEFSKFDDGDDLLVDVMKISFKKKTITNAVWSEPRPPNLIVIDGSTGVSAHVKVLKESSITGFPDSGLRLD